MKKIIITGRGGSGKTSFAALMTKYFIEKNNIPLLLIDADPDQNLGEFVGVDLEKEGVKSVSDILVETFIEGGGTLTGVSPSERIESKIWEEGIYENKFFDLITLGTKWVEGCYCLPDAALKEASEKLAKNYVYVIIDSPAGVEHLNRKIVSEVNDIFDVIDPSKKSFDHVKRTYRIVKEVKISFEKFYVIGGFRFPEELENEVEIKTQQRFLGRIFYDKNVEEYSLSGKSLLNLPNTSPAYISIKNILKKAGY